MKGTSHENRRNKASHGLGVMILLSAILSCPAGLAAEQHRWSDVSRIVAVSDPHGAFAALMETLRSANVIDASGDWSGGESHLVITGDLLDRGADSRKVMDLVMALEKGAIDAGGRVHLTLGNHEVMNLVGDLRYVSAGEYAAFAEDESAAERERWFGLFVANTEGGDSSEVTALRAEFDARHPPGFFAHRRAFSAEGQYGKWLLGKPVMVVINGTAFVHGGLPASVAEFDLDTLNSELGAQVSGYVSNMETLINAGYLDPALNFYDHLDVAEKLLADSTLSETIQSASQAIIRLSAGSIHGSGSPLWYRGSVGCSTVLENDVLEAALDAMQASRVVIGHTPTMTRQIQEKHAGRVIEIDTGMLTSAYHGSGFALVIDGDNLSVLSQDGSTPTSVQHHQRRVGIRPDDMTPADLEQILANGQIVARRDDAEGQEFVELVEGESRITAMFSPNPRNKDFSAPVAAYRLDRLLGLDMVPVTVVRVVDGKKGALQFVPQGTEDEGQRSASGAGSAAWCPMQRQWNAMYIFDTLIHNDGRLQLNMRYSRDNWQLILTGNANAFDSKNRKPKYLEDAPLEYSSGWTAALTALTDDKLSRNLADVLDKRRLAALSKRRDLLLKEASGAAMQR